MKILLAIAGVLYPVLVFVLLAVFKAPVRIVSLCAVALALVLFLSATGNASKGADGKRKLNPKNLISSIFFLLAGTACFATNSAIIWEQPTTKPYAGFRKGRNWCMNYRDVERLKDQVPELDVVTPMVSRWGNTAVHGDKKFNCSLKGLMPNYAKVESPKLRYGRYINDMDVSLRRKVCVIGKHVYKDLFPQGGNPCGERIRIGQSYYSVVGVDYNDGSMSINGNAEDAVSIPMEVAEIDQGLLHCPDSFSPASVVKGCFLVCQGGDGHGHTQGKD